MRSRRLLVVGVFVLLGLGTAPVTHGATEQRNVPALGETGADQAPGEVCQLGQTYTLGNADGNPIKLCLLSVGYRVRRIKTGRFDTGPDGDKKLLVIRFTVENPLPREQRYSKNIRWTAVLPGGRNIEQAEAYTRQPPNDLVSQTLQPAQKIELYAVIQVPGSGELDRLLATNVLDQGSRAARYPLAGAAKRIDPLEAAPADAGSAVVERPSIPPVGPIRPQRPSAGPPPGIGPARPELVNPGVPAEAGGIYIDANGNVHHTGTGTGTTTTPAEPSTPAQPALPPPLVWGFADLHAHPASHLAFGADAQGNGGIIWGKPGLALATAAATLPADMPACAVDSHYGFDADPVRKGTRKEIIKMIDSLSGWEHQANGGNSFANWPHAESVNHQQMHILSIRRAYEGGLRLMVASVTDNQMLSDLWMKIGFNILGNPVPHADPNRELASARKQITFIKSMAAANAGWMQVVRTAAEAETAIKANKLAVILGVEMDSLSLPQILDLVQNNDVRQVVPIHLANNLNFGGTAVYDDAFNTNNYYLTGAFHKVVTNPKVSFSLGRPKVLRSAEFFDFQPGAILPTDVNDATYAALGYAALPKGHINSMGLTAPDSFKGLMKKGLLLDLAHMGEKSTNDAIALAETYHYPLMDTHTGLRSDNYGVSERELTNTQARKIAALGGVLGMGTSAAGVAQTLLKKDAAKAADRLPNQTFVWGFTGDVHDWVLPVNPLMGTAQTIFKLRLIIVTGKDGLAGGNSGNCDVTLRMRSGAAIVLANINASRSWADGTTRIVDLPVPTGTKIGDLVQITLHTPFAQWFGDSWSIDKLQLDAIPLDSEPVSVWLYRYKDALAQMGGRGVALGTDFNGLSPQIPFAASPIPYPMPLPPGAPAGTQPLGASQLGGKTYAFDRDGIAHYGMLPDFLCAVSLKSQSSQAIQALYRSADDVIAMWKKCEAAAQSIP